MKEEVIAKAKEQAKEEESNGVFDAFAYCATFKVELPGAMDSIEDNTCLLDVTEKLTETLRILSAKHPGLRVNYNVGWYGREEVEIPLVVK